MTMLDGMSKVFAHIDLLKTVVNYSIFGGRHVWQESSRSKVCIKVTPRRASYLCCAKGGVWQVDLKPATTHFYKQIRGINLVRFLIEIRASVWGLLGYAGTTAPSPPVNKNGLRSSPKSKRSFAGSEAAREDSRRSSP